MAMIIAYGRGLEAALAARDDIEILAWAPDGALLRDRGSGVAWPGHIAVSDWTAPSHAPWSVMARTLEACGPFAADQALYIGPPRTDYSDYWATGAVEGRWHTVPVRAESLDYWRLALVEELGAQAFGQLWHQQPSRRAHAAAIVGGMRERVIGHRLRDLRGPAPQESPKLSHDARFGELRSLLHDAVGIDAWRTICALLDIRQWPDAEAAHRDAIAYARRSMARPPWSARLCLAPPRWVARLLYTAPDDVPELAVAKHLVLEGTHVTAEVVDKLRTLDGLEDLLVLESPIQGEGLTALLALDNPRLQRIALRRCRLEEPGRLADAACAPQLRALELSGLELRDSIVRQLAANPLLGQIEELDLRNNAIDREGLRALLDAPHAEDLTLWVERNRFERGEPPILLIAELAASTRLASEVRQLWACDLRAYRGHD